MTQQKITTRKMPVMIPHISARGNGRNLLNLRVIYRPRLTHKKIKKIVKRFMDIFSYSESNKVL